MASLRALIPEADSVIAMHPSELAACVLEVLLSSGSPNLWHRDNFMMFAGSEYVNHHGQSNEDVSIACSAAWSWLDANGLITLKSFSSGWYVATPRGREVGGRANVYNLIANQQLPEEFLHPTVVANSRPLYLQSKLDTAVFEAFKALEIAIRTEAGLGHDMVGVALAQRAFNPDTGQLTDLSAEKGERVALMSLMAGAMGSYKNPASHRHVELAPAEAREMLILASHLLRIVEERGARRRGTRDATDHSDRP